MTDPDIRLLLEKAYHERYRDGSLDLIDTIIEGLNDSFLLRLLFRIAPAYTLKKLRVKIETNV